MVSHQCVTRALIVHHHWRCDGETLVHRQLLSCILHAYASSEGVVVQMVRSGAGGWPWWLCRDARLLDAVYLDASVEGPKRKHTSPPSSFLAEQVDAWLSDHAECNVLAAWRKSLCLVETTVPRLRRLWPLVGAARIDAPDGTLHAQRLCTEEEVRASHAYQMTVQRFGKTYATEMAQRMCGGCEAAALYGVHQTDAPRACALFSVVLYEAVRTDDRTSALLLVDTFIVDSACEGQGLGGRIFRDLCLPLGRRHSSRLTVAAQCVVKGAGKKFWHDKLDETAVARALLLQTAVLDHTLVPVQSPTQCTPRAREYDQ